MFQYPLTMSDPLSSFLFYLFFCDAQVPERYQVTAIGSTLVLSPAQVEQGWRIFDNLLQSHEPGRAAMTCRGIP